MNDPRRRNYYSWPKPKKLFILMKALTNQKLATLLTIYKNIRKITALTFQK